MQTASFSALASAGPTQNLGAEPSEQWYYDVIVHSQSWYELFNENVSANQLYEYQKDGSLLELICINSFF